MSYWFICFTFTYAFMIWYHGLYERCDIDRPWAFQLLDLGKKQARDSMHVANPCAQHCPRTMRFDIFDAVHRKAHVKTMKSDESHWCKCWTITSPQQFHIHACYSWGSSCPGHWFCCFSCKYIENAYEINEFLWNPVSSWHGLPALRFVRIAGEPPGTKI